VATTPAVNLGDDPVCDAVAYARALRDLDSLGARRIMNGYPQPEVLLHLLAEMLGAEVGAVAHWSGMSEDQLWDRLATTCDWLEARGATGPTSRA
jgi:hypothetical protein